jgi:serine/threonine protein kinase
MPSEALSGSRVRDDTGIEYVLGDPIGKPGAQGVVYRVEGQPGFAIKLLKRSEDLSRIEEVRRLPLDGLQLAAPISLIREGGSGYLMPLAADMNPLAEPYLPREFGPRETSGTDWYRSTGGLRRRLALAANVAQCLAALHERGLAYVDLNPNNVMVSDDVSRQETWLIDTDNLTSRANPKWDIIGFPGYAVPERVTRKAPPSTLADAYTLAILTFRLLVLRHPLEGVAADTLDGDEAAMAINSGRLPYVADPGDDSNRLPHRSLSSKLLSVALSGRMQQLALTTFGEGRLNPLVRPGAARWRDALWLAHDIAVLELVDVAHQVHPGVLVAARVNCAVSVGDDLHQRRVVDEPAQLALHLGPADPGPGGVQRNPHPLLPALRVRENVRRAGLPIEVVSGGVLGHRAEREEVVGVAQGAM